MRTESFKVSVKAHLSFLIYSETSFNKVIFNFFLCNFDNLFDANFPGIVKFISRPLIFVTFLSGFATPLS